MEKQIQSVLKSVAALYDAGILYQRIVNPTGLMGVDFKFTDNLKIPVNENVFSAQDAQVKPPEWSTERYLAAKRKISTWLVDWEWTVAQHEAGAQFAAKVCK